MIKRIFLVLIFMFSLSNASITINGIAFDDYEQNASTHLITYYPLRTFSDMGLDTTEQIAILNCRNAFSPSLECVGGSLSPASMLRIREQSHLIDWNVYTDQFGMTLHQTNFLYGLTGLLVGFGFYLGFLQVIRKD